MNWNLVSDTVKSEIAMIGARMEIDYGHRRETYVAVHLIQRAPNNAIHRSRGRRFQMVSLLAATSVIAAVRQPNTCSVDTCSVLLCNLNWWLSV